jgi:pimeloyl-ACP methyl ester carboxylesterase
MLLLLHGALGDHTQFDGLRSLLGDAPAHALDFEGHGERPLAGRDFRLAHFAENASEWLAAHATEPVDIFGYSMGGYVALCVAAMMPQRVRSVMTLGTKLVWTPDVAADASKQLDAGMIKAKVPAFAQTLAARHHAAGWERVLEQTALALQALGAQPLLTDHALARIECPVRLAVGDRDVTVPVEELRDTSRTLARGEYEVLPRTPHPFEKVPLERLAWTLRQFISSASA